MNAKISSPCTIPVKYAGRYHIFIVAGAAILGLIVGCAGFNRTANAAVPAAPSAGKALHFSLLPKLAGPKEPALAEINGQKFSSRAFDNTLTELYGMNLFQQWVQVTLLRQACHKEGLHVQKRVVDAQVEKILQGFSAQHVPQGQRHAALAKVLATRGITLSQFRLDLWRSAYIKALAKGHIHVSNKQIREAYNINFGPKVKAVDIVVSNFADAVTVRHLIMKDHKNPEQVARAMSINQQTAKNGGVVLIPLDDPSLPKVLTRTAKRLTAGVVSTAIPINGSLHLLWLLGKIPAQSFSASKRIQIKSIIVKKLAGLLENQWGQREIARLWQAAKIKIDNPILDRQYKALRAAALAQQARNKAAEKKAAATTKPGHKTSAAH